MIVQYNELSSVFRHCQVIIIFCRSVRKNKTLCFPVSFVQKKIQPPDGCCSYKWKPVFTQFFFKKQFFFFLKTHKKKIVRKKYCIAHHDEKICFLPNCRFHIVLKGDIKVCYKNWADAFCFNCQHVDCLHTLFEYHFSGKTVIRRGQLFHNVHRAVDFNYQNRRVDRKPSMAEKILLLKKYKIQLLTSFQKH